MSRAVEVNFDGLIGPTHNYGGLSDGNLASAKNAGDVSNPRKAALQGLEKMRMMVRAGLTQGVLPPQPRPWLPFLSDLGYGTDIPTVIDTAARLCPQHLKTAYSASCMWAANAATVSPSADTQTEMVHLTLANLHTMLHRSLEWETLDRSMLDIFPATSDLYIQVDPALHPHADFSDEGAANHTRLCADFGEQGVEL